MPLTPLYCITHNGSPTSSPRSWRGGWQMVIGKVGGRSWVKCVVDIWQWAEQGAAGQRGRRQFDGKGNWFWVGDREVICWMGIDSGVEQLLSLSSCWSPGVLCLNCLILGWATVMFQKYEHLFVCFDLDIVPFLSGFATHNIILYWSYAA